MAIEIQVEAAASVTLPVATDRVRDLVVRVLRAEQVDSAEISIAFVDDAEIARLNYEYLRHEGPTDVISFPLHLEDSPPLGDIYVGVDQARRQAEEHGVAFTEELLRLAVHGTLHVLGYDHPDGEERFESDMYRRQEALLRELLDAPSAQD